MFHGNVSTFSQVCWKANKSQHCFEEAESQVHTFFFLFHWKERGFPLENVMKDLFYPMLMFSDVVRDFQLLRHCVLYCWKRFIVCLLIIPIVNIHISQLLPLSENEIYQIDLMHDSELMTCLTLRENKKYVLEIFKIIIYKIKKKKKRMEMIINKDWKNVSKQRSLVKNKSRCMESIIMPSLLGLGDI